MKVVIILAALSMLIGACNPQRKIHKAKSVLNEYPDEAAKYCAEKFPVKDSVYVRDSVRFDTLYLQGDPVIEYQTINDTVYKTITVPGTTYFVTKTVTKDSIIIRRDSAGFTALRNQLNDLIVVNKDLVGERDKYKKKAKTNATQKWITWILLLVGLVLGIYFKKWGGAVSSLFKFVKK